ncbi:hypothetical protein LOK49_LG09G00545 [Camellia lanceoleosa]|uniref:Uncharacterized protein n=1 Tax=Camellia lanceoleosa TaxID=1840588 RepID=A0ACC0GKI1_9ERIC|nr:hypothetical protein LOK49_LG09G00545 [Camellia lanceoleosa]
MARELSDRAAERSLFDFTLWVFLNREYDRVALCQSLSQQLYLLSTTKEFEDDDYDREGDEDEVEVEAEKKKEVLRQKISEALAQKSFLLILDDVGKNKKEEIMLELNTLFNLDQ